MSPAREFCRLAYKSYTREITVLDKLLFKSFQENPARFWGPDEVLSRRIWIGVLFGNWWHAVALEISVGFTPVSFHRTFLHCDPYGEEFY